MTGRVRDFLFLFGQAWVKRSAGDQAGADEDLAAAFVPPGSADFITGLIESGEWPEPGPGPAAMTGWLERCRLAGGGDLRLLSSKVIKPGRPDLFGAESAARLDELAADARRRMAAGELREVGRKAGPAAEAERGVRRAGRAVRVPAPHAPDVVQAEER